MEIIDNEMEFTFGSADEASAALAHMKSECDGDAGKLVELLECDGTIVRLPDGSLCLDPQELISVAPGLVSSVAKNNPSRGFTFKSSSVDTYSEAWVDGGLADRMLAIKTTLYPNGYAEALCCPECGEDVVTLEDFDAQASYVCPECGEEVDLSDDYEDLAPEINATIERL